MLFFILTPEKQIYSKLEKAGLRLEDLLGCGSCAYLMAPSPEHSERRDVPIRDANFLTFECIRSEIEITFVSS